MLKQYLTVILAVLVVNLSFSSSTIAAAGIETKETKAAKHAEKVKVGIAKLGTGKDTKVRVKLKDGIKLKGYVSEINENSFVVTDERTGVATEVPYPSAKQVRGNNLSNGAKIAIAVGITIAVIVLIGVLAPER